MEGFVGWEINLVESAGLCRFVTAKRYKMMGTTKLNQLSAYTIAKNCSDLSDVNVGMEELKAHFVACEKAGKKPTNTALIRFSKLAIKRDKLKK